LVSKSCGYNEFLQMVRVNLGIMGWLGREGLKFRVGCFRQKEVISEDQRLKADGHRDKWAECLIRWVFLCSHDWRWPETDKSTNAL